MPQTKKPALACAKDRLVAEEGFEPPTKGL